jgi:uncharacterized membrane protein YeiB
VLGALGALFLVGGPLLLTAMRQGGDFAEFGSRSDVGFGALAHPAPFVHGLLFQYYPAVIWVGFLLVGMCLGRTDLGTPTAGRRLFSWAAPATVLAFTIGWQGARAFGPPAQIFDLAPSPPFTWSAHWTTYGFGNSVGWAISCALLSLAVIGGCVWLTGATTGRVLGPVVALGAASLTFYVLQFAYLGSVWEWLQPHLSQNVANLAVSIACWVSFALLAQLWLRVFRRGPLESVLHAGALVLTSRWWPGGAA